MADRITLPTRNVLAVAAHNDQRLVKWFEDTDAALTELISGAVTGTGGTLDMGDRLTGADFYDGGSRV